jgi:hypothetical protein
LSSKSLIQWLALRVSDKGDRNTLGSLVSN